MYESSWYAVKGELTLAPIVFSLLGFMIQLQNGLRFRPKGQLADMRHLTFAYISTSGVVHRYLYKTIQ